jgi:GNAT superfamily N-acetyltransferase
VDIARENLTEKFVAELSPMLDDHTREVDAHGGAAPLVNWGVYHQLNVAGLLWVFSARDMDGLMVGYVSYIIEPSPHCEGIFTAYQDAFYVMPHARGRFAGPRMLQFAEEMIRKQGVFAIRIGVPVNNNYGSMLTRKGYELTDLVYTKRL